MRFGIVEAEGIGGSIEAGGLPCLRDGEVIGSVGVAGADDAVCVHCAEGWFAGTSGRPRLNVSLRPDGVAGRIAVDTGDASEGAFSLAGADRPF